MANSYFNKSTLSDKQAEEIIRCYANFIAPKDAAERANTSRQTTSAIYLKLSQRLREEWIRCFVRPSPKSRNKRLAEKIERMEIARLYDQYIHGTSIEQYRTERNGRLLAINQHPIVLVSRELRRKWGKISRKSFPAHYYLIKWTTEKRLDWMIGFRYDDILVPEVRKAARSTLLKHLVGSLREKKL